MKQVNGQNNQIIIIFSNERVDYFSFQNERINKIINQADIDIWINNAQGSKNKYTFINFK